MPAAIFRENIADLVELLRSAGRLMYDQLVKCVLILIKGIHALIEAVQPMGLPQSHHLMYGSCKALQD